MICFMMLNFTIQVAGQGMASPGPPSYGELQAENERLKRELRELRSGHASQAATESSPTGSEALPQLPAVEALTASQISRYSRQLLVSEFGTTGQKRLLSSSVLVIGAGEAAPYDEDHTVRTC